MNVFFIGSVLFSRSMLETVLQINNLNIVGIATKKKSLFNSDHSDLSDLALINKIPYKFVKSINDENILTWIKNLSPDVIYCFGWSELIKNKLLSIPKYGIIGYHPAKLPQNRGRHPIIWALVLGLNETASTFFKMDASADSGDIISQEILQISKSDDAKRLYDKLTSLAKKQVNVFSKELIDKNITYSKQSNLKTNYWRKRDKNDGKINFSSNSKTIYNLVRALTKPYVGAHLVYNNEEIKVWKCTIGPNKDSNLEPGKILEVKNSKILIKTADKSILITKHDFVNLPKINTYAS
tara:strand:+ start:6096 stop:6983 length:888 start_codon:yes stop_codon:yes gene_type:complete